MSTQLNRMQLRFLRNLRDSSKPFMAVLRAAEITEHGLALWRTQPTFETEYRRVCRAVTRDAGTDLSIAFSRCVRLVSTEVARFTASKLNSSPSPAAAGDTNPPHNRDNNTENAENLSETPPKEAPNGLQNDEKGRRNDGKGRQKDGKRRHLNEKTWKMCMDVLKTGVGVFVEKAPRRAPHKKAPKLDPAAFEAVVDSRVNSILAEMGILPPPPKDATPPTVA